MRNSRSLPPVSPSSPAKAIDLLLDDPPAAKGVLDQSASGPMDVRTSVAAPRDERVAVSLSQDEVAIRAMPERTADLRSEPKIVRVAAS